MIAFIVIAVVFFAVGYSYGFGKGIEWAVYKGLEFVDIEIDSTRLVNFLLENHWRI